VPCNAVHHIIFIVSHNRGTPGAPCNNAVHYIVSIVSHDRGRSAVQYVATGNACHFRCIVAQAKLMRRMVFDKWSWAQSSIDEFNLVGYTGGLCRIDPWESNF
jgi:hypothetical protein